MCEFLSWVFASVRWPETISALASIVTAAIAFWALHTWKLQDKAKVKAEFLDALVEAAHTYIVEVQRPVTLLEMSKIGMKANEPIRGVSQHTDLAVEGAIAYIKRNGEQVRKGWVEVLEEVQPSVIKLRSLAAKGQVLKFDDYKRGYDAVATMTWHFDRLEAFMAVVGAPTWNWDHPEVLSLLKGVTAIDPNEIRDSIKQSNVELLEFTRVAYDKTYG